DLRRVDEQVRGLSPGLEPSLERLRRCAFVAEPRGRALAELEPALARNDDAAAVRVGRGPARDGGGVAAERAGNQPRVAVEVLVDADAEDDRRLGESDQTAELGNGDLGGRRHDVLLE